jgi:predicted nucleic acid-binding protein
MKAIFADTSYFLGLMISNDAVHAKAVEFSEKSAAPLVTTDWVVMEMGNFLSQPAVRGVFLQWLTAMRREARVTIIEASRGLLDEGIELFANRQDKYWSLTDCISFVIMARYEIGEAATADHHFEQAGFVALLK